MHILFLTMFKYQITKKILLFFVFVFLCQSMKLSMENHMKLKNGDMQSFRTAELNKHNQLRKKHHVPALKLCDQLNAYAQQWAEHLASIGNMVHSQGDYGENLYYVWSSPPRDYKNGAASQSWYDEIKDYKFKKPGFSSKTGHFTQVIWKDSQKVGFGIASTNDGKDFVVAEYSPPGNYIGEFPDNVLPI